MSSITPVEIEALPRYKLHVQTRASADGSGNLETDVSIIADANGPYVKHIDLLTVLGMENQLDKVLTDACLVLKGMPAAENIELVERIEAIVGTVPTDK